MTQFTSCANKCWIPSFTDQALGGWAAPQNAAGGTAWASTPPQKKKKRKEENTYSLGRVAVHSAARLLQSLPRLVAVAARDHQTPAQRCACRIPSGDGHFAEVHGEGGCIPAGHAQVQHAGGPQEAVTIEPRPQLGPMAIFEVALRVQQTALAEGLRRACSQRLVHVLVAECTSPAFTLPSSGD